MTSLALRKLVPPGKSISIIVFTNQSISRGELAATAHYSLNCATRDLFKMIIKVRD